MIIVLINWRILPEEVPEFKKYWSETLKLDHATGLVGEFLSEVKGQDFYEKITWEMEPSDSETDRTFWKSETHESFVNVGIWNRLEDFDKAVGKFMNADPTAMKEFEAAPRRRAVLSPEAWRIGASVLPSESSPGVAA